MPFINVTTADGTLVERIDVSEYDLTMSFAVQALLGEVREAAIQAFRWERDDVTVRDSE